MDHDFGSDEGPPAVAIVGASCRFADVDGVEAFWDALRAGRELVSFFCEEEARRAGADEAWLADPRWVPAGGTLRGADLFDAEFFGISSEDARSIDPQHRVFLESCWQALEHAGHDPARFAGDIGVFGGASANTYLPLLREAGIEPSTPYGNDGDYLTSRVAYHLGLTGPSVTVQAGCSTSLLAVHLAAQSLLNFECDMALAGAVCVSAQRGKGYLHTQDGRLSPDGHTRPFDRDAAGSAPSDGVAVVVLRRLEDVVGTDRVLAVVRGSAVRNDGRRKMGFSTPSGAGLVAVMRAAYEAAELDPSTVDRVEAHAIGTPLGDAIEFDATAEVFGPGRRTLGAVKAAVGHTDAVSGLAALLAAVLQIRHRTLLPVLHFTEPSGAVTPDLAGLDVLRDPAAWPSPGHPRRAGITSATTGGTNVHVVVEEAPPEPVAVAGGPHLVPLSAKSEQALRDSALVLAEHLRSNPGQSLASVAWTLQTGRGEFAHRKAYVAADVGELITALEQDIAPSVHSGPEVLVAAARAWCAGESVRWESLHDGRKPLLTPLPGHPLRRVRHWAGVSEDGGPRGRPADLGRVVPPATTLERALADVFAEVLGVEEVGVTDGFFALGGDSLTALRVSARIRAEIGSAVEVAVVLTHPTVRDLAAAVDATAAGGAGPAPGRAVRRPVRELRQSGGTR
ncbi:beta-ketoacyl synthase N-terminal-like domain-containing protein [Lentzea sp. NPDC059081]|uniref:beta-ketoacyl synthase N-terminal-like domain-containing protein n=1 Tax=Lentzea sp. NPDC059081 TaxID=3346719 RepID=UPI0036979096